MTLKSIRVSRRLPWEPAKPEPYRRYHVGLVPLILYWVGVTWLGWALDRNMPDGIRAGFWGLRGR